MDDDIKKFMIRQEDKNLKVSPVESVTSLERIFDSYKNLGMIAHRYCSFAFSQKDELSFNQNPCSSILVHNKVDAQWNFGTVDDADFALQVLTSGLSTVIANRHLIDTVPHNKQAGGLTDKPNHHGRHARFLQLVKDWPGGFSVKVDDSGKPKLVHHRIWSKFEQRPVPRKSKR